MKEDMKVKKTSIKATAVTSFYPLYDEEEENEEEEEEYAYEEYEYYEDLEQVLNTDDTRKSLQQPISCLSSSVPLTFMKTLY